MKIVGGKHRARALLSPKDHSIRPTSERTRESLFNILMHGAFGGDAVIDQPVLDLCCGSGALGLEALSRGAAHCTFIDKSKDALHLAEANAHKLGELARSAFILADITRLPAARAAVPLVLMDPPYRSGLIQPAYGSLIAQGWLQTGSLLVCEQDQKEPLPELAGCTLHTERRYGKARLLVWAVE